MDGVTVVEVHHGPGHVLVDASTVRLRSCQMPEPFKLGNSGKERSPRWGTDQYYQRAVPCQGWVLSHHSRPRSLCFDLGPLLPWISSFSLFLDSPVASLNEQCQLVQNWPASSLTCTEDRGKEEEEEGMEKPGV